MNRVAPPSLVRSEITPVVGHHRGSKDHGQRSADKPLVEAIAEQAKLSPESVALVMGADELTYGELDQHASQLANYLQSLGAAPEVLVGLCLERSAEFVIAALAILKCGAAYLPMDAAHPAERLRFIMQDAGISLLVTRANLAESLSIRGVRMIDLDAERETIRHASKESPKADLQADQLAYVIYTSGSTGEPKGVEITHRNLSNLIAWHLRAFSVDSSARATFQAGVGFDAAVWEIWPALTVGAALYLPADWTRLSAELLRDWLVAKKITISFVPTAIAEQLIALPWPAETALRFLLTGADTLQRHPPPALPFKLVNNYGPTECTVVASSGLIAAAPHRESVPTIGSSIDNVQLHIADEHLREMADGEAGEIYIGGAGVARGYRNRPDLTAQRFVPDPFGVSGARLYRTGDRARRLPNGEIAFLGRLDDQVKIRGYRIELGEINAALKSHESVQSSIVIAREDVPGEKRLVAYLVASPGAIRDEQSLRESLRLRLPDYMEPAAFVWVDSLPLTPNGKIDRAALPAPSATDASRTEPFVAARTPVEETLSGIITEVLKVPRVSVHDDFFHLGAHSLLGAQVIARVRGVFGAELKLLDVFDSPTVAELSVKIEEALTRQLASMSDAEVAAALAASDEAVT